MAQPSMRTDIPVFRAFLAVEGGGTGIEFPTVAAGVGLALSTVLYVAGGVLTDKFDALASALKRQNNSISQASLRATETRNKAGAVKRRFFNWQYLLLRP
jgi:Flp pilus assembly pilin Flp